MRKRTIKNSSLKNEAIAVGTLMQAQKVSSCIGFCPPSSATTTSSSQPTNPSSAPATSSATPSDTPSSSAPATSSTEASSNTPSSSASSQTVSQAPSSSAASSSSVDSSATSTPQAEVSSPSASSSQPTNPSSAPTTSSATPSDTPSSSAPTDSQTEVSSSTSSASSSPTSSDIVSQASSSSIASNTPSPFNSSTTRMLIESTINATASSFFTWAASATTGLLTQSSRAMISSSSSTSNTPGTDTTENPMSEANSSANLIYIVIGVIIGSAALVILGYTLMRLRKTNNPAVDARLAMDQLDRNEQPNGDQAAAGFEIINPMFAAKKAPTNNDTVIDVSPEADYLVPVANLIYGFEGADATSSASDPDSQNSSGIEKSATSEENAAPVANTIAHQEYDVLIEPSCLLYTDGTQFSNPQNDYEEPATLYAVAGGWGHPNVTIHAGGWNQDNYDTVQHLPSNTPYDTIAWEDSVVDIAPIQPRRPKAPLLSNGIFALQEWSAGSSRPATQHPRQAPDSALNSRPY